MDDLEAPPQLGPYVTPLLISAAGIICSALAIAAYHFILLRFCLRPPQTRRSRINNRRPQGQKIGGVEEEILSKIPVLSYSPPTGEAFRLDQSECAVCLGELVDDELVRLLPACGHAFHVPCIDAWFVDHSNCPVCRSPITCDCESAVPKASENGGEQRVSHHVPGLPSDRHRLMSGDELSASTSRFQQPLTGLLRHSVSVHVALHMEKKPRASGVGLKRSLSSSYIDHISIRREHEKASSSSSSSSSSYTKGFVTKARSLRHLDPVSSVLIRSFSQFRNSRSGRSNGSILPI